jgi:hypothetical protein
MKVSESQLRGSGLATFSVFWARDIHKLSELWEKATSSKRDELIIEYERWKEQAFIAYRPLVLTQGNFDKSFVEAVLLRDVIVFSFFHEVTDRSLIPFFVEVWRESATKQNSFNQVFEDTSLACLGRTQVYFTPHQKGLESVQAFKDFFDSLPLGQAELTEEGKLFLLAERGEETWEEFVYAYNEESPFNFKFLWFDCLVICATYHKLCYLVSKYQESRLTTISEKKTIDGYVQESLRLSQEGRRDYIKLLPKIEEAGHILSEHAAWLSQKAQEAKNLSTTLEMSLGEMRKLLLKQFSTQGSNFWSDRLASLESYLQQAKNDHSYLRDSLSDVEMTLRNLRDRSDILQKSMQETFYKRVLILIGLAILLVVVSVWFYYFSTSIGIIR